jgi:hypothetical protein
MRGESGIITTYKLEQDEHLKINMMQGTNWRRIDMFKNIFSNGIL